MSAIRTATFPTGTVINWSSSKGAPNGWLYCFGQSLSRTQYSRLFSAIGVQYGSADANSFTVPDIRGRVIVAPDNMGGTAAGVSGYGTALGAAGGEQTHQLTIAEMASHTHLYAHMYQPGGYLYSPNNYAVQNPQSAGIIGGANQPHQNMQPTIIMLTIIKT
jgi:microcystin-dependent protein